MFVSVPIVCRVAANVHGVMFGSEHVVVLSGPAEHSGAEPQGLCARAVGVDWAFEVWVMFCFYLSFFKLARQWRHKCTVPAPTNVGRADVGRADRRRQRTA